MSVETSNLDTQAKLCLNGSMSNTPTNPIRCWDHQLPDDKRCHDYNDAKLPCDTCGKQTYAHFNAEGRVWP